MIQRLVFTLRVLGQPRRVLETDVDDPGLTGEEGTTLAGVITDRDHEIEVGYRTLEPLPVGGVQRRRCQTLVVA